MSPAERIRGTERQFASGILVDLVAVGVVLTAMLIANVEWLFNRPLGVDTWMYFGFFRHYDIPDYLAGNKKIARLPWILIGFVANKLFTPEKASLVLHVGCFALGVFYLYKLVEGLFGRRVALITALTYVTWVPIHGAGGWDYHNTILPVFYFTAYRALIVATSASRTSIRGFLSVGILYALAVHTNIMTLLLAPAFVLRATHLVNQRSKEAEQFFYYRACAGVIGGALIVTILLGTVNAVFGRSFVFWQVLVLRSAYLIGHPILNSSEWLPWSNLWWVDNVNTPLFDSVIVLIVISALLRRRQWSLSRLFSSSRLTLELEFLVCTAVFAVGQAAGQEMLEPFYMAMPLALPMFLALAALVSEIDAPAKAEGGKERIPSSVAFVIFACVAFGLQFVGRFALPLTLFGWTPHIVWYNMPPMVLTIGGFVIAAVISRVPIDKMLRGYIALGTLAVALAQANTIWPLGDDDRLPYDFRATSCKVRQALLATVSQADDVLFPSLRNRGQIGLWYRADERAGQPNSPEACVLLTDHVGRALFAMGYGAGEEHFWDMETSPDVSATVASELSSRGYPLVLISNDNHYVERELARMRQFDKRWRIEKSEIIGRNETTFGLHVLSSR